MAENHKQIAVIGGGSWATALVKILTAQDEVVNWWMHNEASANHILKFRHNPKYLQSVEFDLDKINVGTDLQEIVQPSDILIIATPSLAWSARGLSPIFFKASNPVICFLL